MENALLYIFMRLSILASNYAEYEARSRRFSFSQRKLAIRAEFLARYIARESS